MSALLVALIAGATAVASDVASDAVKDCLSRTKAPSHRCLQRGIS